MSPGIATCPLENKTAPLLRTAVLSGLTLFQLHAATSGYCSPPPHPIGKSLQHFLQMVNLNANSLGDTRQLSRATPARSSA